MSNVGMEEFAFSNISAKFKFDPSNKQVGTGTRLPTLLTLLSKATFMCAHKHIWENVNLMLMYLPDHRWSSPTWPQISQQTRLGSQPVHSKYFV